MRSPYVSILAEEPQYSLVVILDSETRIKDGERFLDTDDGRHAAV